jgi:hypothetical protein
MGNARHPPQSVLRFFSWCSSALISASPLLRGEIAASDQVILAGCLTGRELPALEKIFRQVEPVRAHPEHLPAARRGGLKDSELAEDVRRAEQDHSLSAGQSREEIAKAVEAKYTAPV